MVLGRAGSATTSPKSGRTIERWSSNSSSWNLSLLSKPKSTVTKVSVSGSRKSMRSKSNGVMLREVHNGASTSNALTYDRSGDANGRHKWERDSSGSLLSAEELGFEAYDRPGKTVHTLDEEDFPFSPIASSFVFGEHNNSVEFLQRGGRSGIPRAVGPIVQEFTSSTSTQNQAKQHTSSGKCCVSSNTSESLVCDACTERIGKEEGDVSEMICDGGIKRCCSYTLPMVRKQVHSDVELRH